MRGVGRIVAFLAINEEENLCAIARLLPCFGDDLTLWNIEGLILARIVANCRHIAQLFQRCFFYAPCSGRQLVCWTPYYSDSSRRHLRGPRGGRIPYHICLRRFLFILCLAVIKSFRINIWPGMDRHQRA